MGLLSNLRYLADRWLLEAGYIRKEDALRPYLPLEDREEIVGTIKQLFTHDALRDPILATKKIDHLNQKLTGALSKMAPGDRAKSVSIMGGGTGISGLGYEPTGSQLRKLYPNPFAVYAFLGENYWAAVESRRQVRVEVLNDSYVFHSLPSVSRKQVRLAWDLLNELGLLSQIDTMVDHLNLYGNCWLLPERNLLNGLLRYTVLQPERMLPRWDTYKLHVIGWEYQDQGRRVYYEKDELVHLYTYSARTADMGAPTLSGVVVAMEACMYADLYNSTVFQKGGMIGNIISLKTDPNNSLINEKNWSLLADTVQAKFDKRYGGVRGAGQNVISPWVEKVFNLSKPGDMDGTHRWYTDATDRKVAMLLGCSPERIGVPITSQYQDKGLVADRVTELFDNKVNYLANICYDLCNKVLQDNGIKGVMITSGGAYKSTAVAASQFGLQIAQIGGVMTVDEYRVNVLKMEPWGGELGNRLLYQGAAAGDMSAPVQGPDLPVGKMRQITKGWVPHTVDQIKGYNFPDW